MAKNVFNRYENKYLINRTQYQKLVADLSKKMKPDKHNKNGQMYKIYSVYYDTESDNLIRTSLEKPMYKEKIRMRAYNIVGDKDIVYVEIKKKFDGLVNKRRLAMRFNEARQFLEGNPINFTDYMDLQVSQELMEIIQREKLSPKVHISYERMAFFDRKDDDLRISFDHAITSRRHHVSLDNNVKGHQLLPKTKYLMEIKTHWNMPLWLTKILTDYKIHPISFSKYGREYLANLKEVYV